MPTNEYLQARIIKQVEQWFREHPNYGISRSMLLKHFGRRSRPQVTRVIEQMVQAEAITRTGQGTRGSPERYEIGPSFPYTLCPGCKQPSHRAIDPIRVKIIRIVKDSSTISRHDILEHFNHNQRWTVNDQIGLLLSQSVFVQTGRGRAHSPVMIHYADILPNTRCRVCLQDIRK